MTKLRNVKMERMYYIQEIKKDILKSLYAEAEKKLEKLMWEVGEENQTLLQCNTPTFFFNNRWWPLKDQSRYKDCNGKLHHTLYNKVQEIVDEAEANKDVVKAGIDAMVSNFLSVAGHIKDIDRLFPAAIQSIIPDIHHDIFNIKEPLSDIKIAELLDKNKINLNYLKKLLMTKLLLRS